MSIITEEGGGPPGLFPFGVSGRLGDYVMTERKSGQRSGGCAR